MWLVLLFASAGVFHHSGIKIPYFAFFAHDSGKRVAEAPFHMLLAMGLTAFGCLALGCAPWLLYDFLPYAVEYQPYTAFHVVSQLQLLLFSALAFTVLNRFGIYPKELRSTVLDFDWVYRRPLPWLVGRSQAFGSWLWGELLAAAGLLLDLLLVGVRALHGPDGVFARTWSAGGIARVAALMLGFYLLVFYVFG